MIVLGLLLILVAAGAAGFAVMASTATSKVIDLTAVGFTVSASPLAMFLAGAVSVVLLTLGFALVNRGTRHKAAARKELRHLRKEQAATGATDRTISSTDTNSSSTSSSTSRDKDPDTDTQARTSTDPDADTQAKTSTDSESPSSR